MINVIGMGYIGLPTALILAANGNDVVGTDYKAEVIENLKRGRLTFREDGLQELFDEARDCGIRFTEDYIKTDMYIISVPTPYNKATKKVDSSYVQAAVQRVAEVCARGSVIVIESTIPPGTIDKSIRPVLEAKGFVTGKDVHLVHAPERIIPGNMLFELRKNARTIGADDQEIGERVKRVYETFCSGEIVVTDIRTAEMTKVVENTYRDINIAFANELAKICHSGDLDLYEVIRIANKHPRVNILNPGPGVGGHCISVDPWFLIGDYPGLANIILAARKINTSMPEFVLERIYEIMTQRKVTDISRVGLYGLAYKENVDDIRESPTLQMLESMRKHLAVGVRVYDPYVQRDVVENQSHSLEEFLRDIDLIVLMVGHDEIKENMALLRDKIVLDTRNICPFPTAYRLA
ncbi:nucleotide sugar dehydrogenase [Oscillospiraceae bacterium 38-13]